MSNGSNRWQHECIRLMTYVHVADVHGHIEDKQFVMPWEDWLKIREQYRVCTEQYAKAFITAE